MIYRPKIRSWEFMLNFNSNFIANIHIVINYFNTVHTVSYVELFTFTMFLSVVVQLRWKWYSGKCLNAYNSTRDRSIQWSDAKSKHPYVRYVREYFNISQLTLYNLRQLTGTNIFRSTVETETASLSLYPNIKLVRVGGGEFYKLSAKCCCYNGL